MTESKTLTRADLVKSLVDKGVGKELATNIVYDFFEVISEALASGDYVKIANLGTLHLRDKSERPGRNPRTKKYAMIVARRVICWKPSVKLRQLLALMKPSQFSAS